MVVFALEVEHTQPVELFVKETNERLLDNNMVKNPFYGCVIFNKINHHVILFFDMKSVFIIQPPKWLLRFASKRGLRKVGYLGQIKSYSNKELINYMGGILWARKK